MYETRLLQPAEPIPAVQLGWRSKPGANLGGWPQVTPSGQNAVHKAKMHCQEDENVSEGDSRATMSEVELAMQQIARPPFHRALHCLSLIHI